MYIQCTCMNHVYTMYIHVYTMYVHGITSCLNRFSWPILQARSGVQVNEHYILCCRHVCTNHIQLCTLYIHVHVVDICNHVLPRWTQEQLKKVIAMPDAAGTEEAINTDSTVLVLSLVYMHTIHGTHVQCLYTYIHCMYIYMQCMCMF